MSTSTRLDAPPAQVVRRMVELACLAPSIHNTQPWAWRASGHEVWLHADTERRLAVEDPLGRNLVISCGAALHHIQLAARALGWRADVERLPDPTDPTMLAHVRLRREPGPRATGIVDAMRNRCTDRRRFTSWPVPEERLEALAEEARNWDVSAAPVLDIATKFRIELTIRRALDLRARDMVATAEQGLWTGRFGTDGVPLRVVPDAPVGDDRLSRFGDGLLRDTRTEVESGDGLIVLGGDSDDPIAWLRTGEGLSALWLRASRSGLSVVPLSQPVEVPTTRAELSAQLAGSLEPHLLVRLGWQAIGRSELPRTPRRPVGEVLRA
jgi:hypothetical protein